MKLQVFVPLDVDLDKNTLESLAGVRSDMTTAERRLKENLTEALTTTEKYGHLFPHLPFTTPDPRWSYGHRPFTSANPTTAAPLGLGMETTVSTVKQSDPAKVTNSISEGPDMSEDYSRRGQLLHDGGLSATGKRMKFELVIYDTVWLP